MAARTPAPARVARALTIAGRPTPLADLAKASRLGKRRTLEELITLQTQGRARRLVDPNGRVLYGPTPKT